MHTVTCRECKEKLLVIEFRIALHEGREHKCKCGRRWTPEDIEALLDSIDIRRFRKKLRAKLPSGAICPCCDQHAKVYRRKMSSTIARFLIALAKLALDDPHKCVHVNETGALMGGASSSTRSGDYAKARFWKLIEPGENDDPSKKSSGLWKLTETGWDFVLGKATVAESALVYNDKLLGFEGDQIDIKTALGTKFNYAELMESVEDRT